MRIAPVLAGAALTAASLAIASPADAHIDHWRSAFACGGTRTYPMNANHVVFEAHIHQSSPQGWTYHGCESTDLVDACYWNAYYINGIGPFGPIDAVCGEL